MVGEIKRERWGETGERERERGPSCLRAEVRWHLSEEWVKTYNVNLKNVSLLDIEVYTSGACNYGCMQCTYHDLFYWPEKDFSEKFTQTCHPWCDFFIKTDLEKCSITSLVHSWILCSEWVPSEWESKQLIKTSETSYSPSINVFRSNKIRGFNKLLRCFYQLFELLFWRHPFAAEDPLKNKVM